MHKAMGSTQIQAQSSRSTVPARTARACATAGRAFSGLARAVLSGAKHRLCPATEDLTEECSQKYPLEFATDFTAAVVAAATTVGKSTVVGGGGLLV